MGKIEIGEWSCHITNDLKTHWQKNSLARLKKTNSDRVYIVDGMEGVGKSTFVFQQAAALEPSLFDSPEKFVSRIAFSPEQFLEIVRSTKNGVVIFDEAFRGLSSRAALSKTNKKLISALMEMRQNNNIVFIVLPSFFMLDIYAAMLRSTALFNIYMDKRSGKRVWQGFNKRDKNAIYQVGIKKGWMYFKKSFFRGNFYSKFPIDVDKTEFYQESYLHKKDQAFTEEKVQSREFQKEKALDYQEKFYKMLGLVYKNYIPSQRKLSKALSTEVGIAMNQNAIKEALKNVQNTEKPMILEQ